jgi:hypothetical protein
MNRIFKVEEYKNAESYSFGLHYIDINDNTNWVDCSNTIESLLYCLKRHLIMDITHLQCCGISVIEDNFEYIKLTLS